MLGASGAGKSIFMQAGLLRRLGRYPQSFLPLPVVRPKRTAITGETGPLPQYLSVPPQADRGDRIPYRPLVARIRSGNSQRSTRGSRCFQVPTQSHKEFAN